MCKESLINDVNWKNAYTKGYVLSLIIWGGGGQAPPSEVLGGASGPPGPPCSYSTEELTTSNTVRNVNDLFSY